MTLIIPIVLTVLVIWFVRKWNKGLGGGEIDYFGLKSVFKVGYGLIGALSIVAVWALYFLCLFVVEKLS